MRAKAPPGSPASIRKKTEGVGIRAGISADQFAARDSARARSSARSKLGLESPSLAGGCDSGYSCAYTNTVSWRGPTTPLPVEVNPRAVFERLFGDGDSTDPAARLAALKEQRSILDYVSGSIDRLETKLGKSDRSKLTEYLEAIRDIERRIQKAEQQSAELKIPAMERPSRSPEQFEDHAKLMMDLQVIAFQTDMTRVITFMLGRAGSNRPYRNIGISDGHHSHHAPPERSREDRQRRQDRRVPGQTFAYFLEKLKRPPTARRQSARPHNDLYGSSLGDANIHTHHDLPIALVAGNRFFEGNRHLVYPKDTPLNNLFLSMFAKANVPCEGFGDSTGLLPYV